MEQNFLKYLEAAETLKKLITPSFGPCGSQVLICTESGQCLVSKDGKTITEACVAPEPLNRWIKDRVKGFYKSSGDGSKSFVLLLSELLQRVKAHHAHFGTSDENQISSISLKSFCWELMEYFTFLARETIPSIIATKIISNSVCRETSFSDTDEFWEFLKQLTFSVLQGNLGKENARLLSDLAIRFVKLHNPESHLEEHISYVTTNFTHFCQEVSGYSVTDSHIMEGTLLQRDFTYQDPALAKGDSNLNVLLTACEYFQIVQQPVISYVTLSSTEGIARAASWNETKWKQFVDNLKRLNVTAIVSVNIVPEPLIAVCRPAGISVIHSVYVEDLCHISDQTGVPLNYNFQENLTWSIHTVTFLRRVVLGKDAFCSVGFRSKTGRTLKHLVMCGPTSTICRAYSSAVQNSLKNVTITLRDAQFELDSQSNKFNHEQLRGIHEGGDGCTIHKKLYAVYGSGVAEVLASNIIRDLSEKYTNKMTRLAFNCVAESLDIIPRTLHNNSYQVNPTKYLAGKVGSVQGSAYGINASTGHWVPAREVSILEPLMHKLTLWQQVLETACDMFRIDSIIGVSMAKD